MKQDETGADGFVPMRSLGTDYFHYDEARHAVIGERTGEMHRLGDQVEVKLLEAIPLAGALRFELLSDGSVLPKKDRPKGGPRGGNRGKATGRPDKGSSHTFGVMVDTASATSSARFRPGSSSEKTTALSLSVTYGLTLSNTSGL